MGSCQLSRRLHDCASPAHLLFLPNLAYNFSSMVALHSGVAMVRCDSAGVWCTRRKMLAVVGIDFYAWSNSNVW